MRAGTNCVVVLVYREMGKERLVSMAESVLATGQHAIAFAIACGNKLELGQ